MDVPPGDGEVNFVCDRQDSLQVLGAKCAGLPEGDAGGEALDDDRVRVVLDPLVRHLDGVLDAQCLPILPVEQVLDLLPQSVGQVDPGQLGLQTLWRQETFKLSDVFWNASVIQFGAESRPVPENPGLLDSAAVSSVTASLASSSLEKTFKKRLNCLFAVSERFMKTRGH